ncbi:MAG: hypothetical protein ABJA83_04695 [Burkholderiaceae bacterium]
MDGHFIIDLEDRSIDLQPRQGFVVPKGVFHRTRAPDRAVILMVETATVVRRVTLSSGSPLFA